MILVDTSVWSLALRRKYSSLEEQPAEVRMLQKLIEDNSELVALTGIVLQEFLSGLREEAQFEQLHRLIKKFPVILATEQHHIEAAKIFNTSRRVGIATSMTDCLTAAIAIQYNAQLFTTDQDFIYMARYCPLKIFPMP